MERGDEGRKRAREGDETRTRRDHNTAKKTKLVSHVDDKLDHTAIKLQKQKQKQPNFDFDDLITNADFGYNAGCTDDGVFNFPWLKEGVSFEADGDGCRLDLEDNIFASYLTLQCDEALAVGCLDDQFMIPTIAGQQNLMCQYSPKLLTLRDHHDQDDLPLFQGNELEGVDWICSSVID